MVQKHASTEHLWVWAWDKQAGVGPTFGERHKGIMGPAGGSEMFPPKKSVDLESLMVEII